MYEEVVISGGAGFVGSNLAIALKERFPATGVTALDNLHRRGSELNLERLRSAGVRFVHGDVRCAEDLAALPRPGLIVECSAEPSAQAGYGDSPEYLIQTNLFGCFRCLELARLHQADLLFLSTSRVYPYPALNALPFREDETRFSLLEQQPMAGASGQGISEQFPLAGPRSLYGMTKLASELMIVEYAEAYGIRYVIDRCGVLAGPRQMGKTDQGVIALWVASHYFQKPLNYIGYGGEGKQVRDVLHIADLCDLVADQSADFARYHGHTFNVGGGLAGSVSLAELTDLCRRITGREIPVGSSPDERAADVRIYISDHSRLTSFSGWLPRRRPEAVVSDIFDWLRADERRLRTVLFPE